MNQAKRVILRLREAEVNYEDPYESVRLYLENDGRSVKELEVGRHFVHVQPPNPDIPQIDPKIHIVIDMEKDSFSGTPDEHFPHEIYRIRRLDNKMVIFAFQDGVWYRNFLRKLRAITDDLYPWGRTRHDRNLSIHTGARSY